MTREISRVKSWWGLFQEASCIEKNDRGGNTEVRRQRAIDVHAHLRPDKAGATGLPGPQHHDIDAIDAVTRARPPERCPISCDTKSTMRRKAQRWSERD